MRHYWWFWNTVRLRARISTLSLQIKSMMPLREVNDVRSRLNALFPLPLSFFSNALWEVPRRSKGCIGHLISSKNLFFTDNTLPTYHPLFWSDAGTTNSPTYFFPCFWLMTPTPIRPEDTTNKTVDLKSKLNLEVSKKYWSWVRLGWRVSACSRRIRCTRV